MTNKSVLQKANAALSAGDYEGFLSHCTQDCQWTFIGDITLRGLDSIRKWMTATYQEPPKFIVEEMIAEGDALTAVGRISLKDDKGIETEYLYADIWRFRDGKMAELKAFVIKY